MKESSPFYPKKSLGQHFLKSQHVIHEIITRAGFEKDSRVLEVGPGRGALTLPLAARAARVVAVEIDPVLAEGLRRHAPANVEIVVADALAADLRSLVPRGSRLAGNLPYYVSSPLLRRFLSLRGHVRDLHVMLQDEVARRVASPPGSREYGILSVLYALWTETDIPARFPPGSFSPPPKVGSAVLRARFVEPPRAEVGDPDGFERFLQKAFARRRRTLENNLEDSYPNLKEYFKFLNVEGSRRAETLSVVEFAALWGAVRGDPTGARG